MADAVGVDVDERDRRGRIVADAAALADHRGVAQLPDRNIGKVDVDRLAGDALLRGRIDGRR